MYIRIQNNVIRYRVSKDEAQNLIDGEKLIDRLVLSEKENLIYTIIATDETSSFTFISSQKLFSLTVNKNLLINELEVRPSKSGIIIEQNNEFNRQIFLEVDIKKPK